MLWCVCFLNYADRQAIFSVFTPLQAEFHLSDIQLAMLASAFIWVYALAGPLTGWIADRVSRKAVILAALAFWSVVTAAVAVSHDFHTLVLLRALSGLGEAFYFPAAMSLLASYHTATTRSRAMSIHQTAVYGGTIAGGALSAYIAQHAGWRSTFSSSEPQAYFSRWFSVSRCARRRKIQKNRPSKRSRSLFSAVFATPCAMVLQ